MSQHQHQAALRQHTPMARSIARGFMRRLPCTVLREDVEQAALIGLWDGLRKRPDNAEPGHEWYLKLRIRGAILDELRSQDWLPRRARAGALRGQPAAVVVRFDDLGGGSSNNGRFPDMVSSNSYPWEERFASGDPDPTEAIDTAAECAEAWRAPLTDRDRKVIHMTEVRGMKFKDVADDFGVSEPRISQLHARALLIMRAHLTGNVDHADRRRGAGYQIPIATKAIIKESYVKRDSAQRDNDHKNDQRSDRAAGSHQDRPRPAQPDAAPVRTGGLGAPPPGRPARPSPGALPGGSRILEIHRAACAGLQRAGLPGVYGERGSSVSAALQVALPEEGLDLRAELAECQAALVTQALSRSGDDLTAAAKLLGLTPLELARAQTPSPAAAGSMTQPRPEDPVMKQPPAPRPKLVGALASLPEPLPTKAEFGRIEGGLLKIETHVIKRLDTEGYTIRQIANRLGVCESFVERVLRMLARPMAKCGPKERGETGKP